MKKTLSVVMGSVFLLGFAATSAFATHADIPAETSVTVGSNAAITLDGSIRMRGLTQKDTKKDSASKAVYDGRVRLGVKAALSDAASGYIQLETGAGSGDTYTWGMDDADNLHKGGEKVGSLEVLQAWINYKPGKFGVKVGHMPLMLGNKIFFDHTGSGDDAIQAYMATENTVAALLAIKFVEGDGKSTIPAGPAGTISGEDVNGYVALLTQKLGGGMNVGANLTNLRKTNAGMDFYNLGVDFSGKFGPASVKADVEYQFGDLSDKDAFAATADSKAKGYAIMVDGTMAAGPANVGLMIGYGSGDDASAPATNTDKDGFVNFLTDTYYDSFMVGYRYATPGQFDNAGDPLKNTGLTNITMVKLHGDIKTTCPITKKDLSLKAGVSYLQLTEEINNYGTNMEDEVGVELEFVGAWKLSNGLVYKIESAYLIAGDAYKIGPTDDPDDSYFLRNSLELKF